MADYEVSQTDVQALADALRQNGAAVAEGPRDTFCQRWPDAKRVLELLRDIIKAVPIPGLPAFVGMAISGCILAGDAAHRALCGGQ